uniref:Uncharacterized protein n=1 Tax=Parascaris equorum TaxID=6256 RepID=A0A914S1D3_PAREQ
MPVAVKAFVRSGKFDVQFLCTCHSNGAVVHATLSLHKKTHS